MGLDQRLKMARLYLCTDLRGSLDAFGEFVEQAFSGGVDIVELRQRGLDLDAEVEALELARTISYRHQGLVVVSDRPEVAKKFNADAIQLGEDDAEPKVARSFLHQWGLIGRVTSTEDELRTALADPEVNFLSVGPVNASPNRPGKEATGTGLLGRAAQLLPPGDPAAKPWFAGGGLTADNLDGVLAVGARRILVNRAITEAKDPQAAARELAQRVKAAWDADPAMQEFLRRTQQGGQATFITNPDGSITVDENTNAPAAMPTGEQDHQDDAASRSAADPTPGHGSTRRGRE